MQLRLMHTASETNGDLLEMEATVAFPVLAVVARVLGQRP
jgi:hypothetical protein